MAAEEMELARWAEAAGKASGANTGAPLVEDAGEEATEGEAESDEPPATGRGRVLRRARFVEPVHPRRTEPWQGAQEEPVL